MMNATTNMKKPDIKDYQGGKSTLCVGCGHDSVTQHIINAYFKSGVSPLNVIKLSGIGCSSKTPAYFMNQSHGFNSLHGRMAAVATGAKLANHKLQVIGISGDGDSASIGLGSFMHTIRRNLPMVYIVENNGVYGLTKGQFSATADYHSAQKSGELNPFTHMDLCSLAIEAGCEFVARSFSGDAKQLVPLIQAAIAHNGTAFIDVISPCITYANHEGSTKSYDYVKEHKVALQELGFVLDKEADVIDSQEGEITKITMANGSILTLKKITSESHDVKNGGKALEMLYNHRQSGEILTGLLYLNKNKKSLVEALELDDRPLALMGREDLCPQPEQFHKLLAAFR